MKKETLKRITAAALAFAVTASGSAVPSVVQAQSLLVRTQSETQMTSDKEAVYVNTYSASARELDFDENWKFYLGDASGADSKTYDDSAWDNVTLPHDYSIDQEYTSAGEAESAFLLGGTGWYRKHFNLDSDMQGKEIRIDFDGVYMDSTVWVNGTQVGAHPYGYTPFSFDITDYVTFDQENVITVKVDHQTPSSRWYSGSGIYRDVTLTVTDPVHVDLYGTEVSTPDLETEKDGTVSTQIKTTISNAGETDTEVVLIHTIYEKGTENSIGTVTTDAITISAGASASVSAVLPADHPKLWSPDDPALYTITTQVKANGTITDTYDTEFGFRYFKFDSNTGFSLNGEKMKLKGVCMHHDQGALGSEAYSASIRRQVKLLKEMGCNSIRITHNPGAKEMIQACNELGMLVIEEAFDGWEYAKNGNTNDYSRFYNQTIGSDNAILGGSSDMTWSEFDLTAMIRRDYNAPAIIMWSLGNEVWEDAYSGGSAAFVTQAERLSTLAKELDSSRPSTIGDNKLKEQNQYSFGMAEKLIAVDGVIGANYCNGAQYDTVHKKYPDAPLYGSETASHTNSRGIYNITGRNVQNPTKTLTSYDYSCVDWGETASNAWYTVITRDYVAGEYVWTGFDYLGEPTPYNKTTSGNFSEDAPKNSYFGIIDTAGLPKDNYYFYQSQWNDDVTTLHVLPAWNENVVSNKNNVPIVVYSNAAAVELFFTDANGERTSLGKKEFTKVKTSAGFTYQIYQGEDKESAEHQNLYLTWHRAYADGMIEAVAYDEDGQVITDTVGRSYVKTTGSEVKLQASADRTQISADGKDLSYITVDITDAEGNIVPDADNNVTFTVEGDGVLVGVDNGKQSDHQSYQDDNRDAFSGSLVAIVQSTKNAGSFTVTATSNGLASASVTVKTTAVSNDIVKDEVDYFFMAKNYYVKTGNKVELPETLEAHYPDGTVKELSVVWDEITNTTGSFGVNGVAGGKYEISVTVNMIDDIAALLNYSTTTPVGQAPVLPASRPAVDADGNILDVTFPVTWETVEADAYAAAGTFTVYGVSNVFGVLIDVTASIRVQDETIKLAGKADKYLDLTQNIPDALQSDTLTALWDGNTTLDSNTSGEVNSSAWSNYAYSQEGNTTADIVFSYATQQRIGEITIYFCQDSGAMTYPDADKTEIWISEDGAAWTEVATQETIGTSENNVCPYTYTFTPFTATFIKFHITNAVSLSRDSVNPCTGITEIDIQKAVGTYNTQSEAALSSLTVNGVALTSGQLAEDDYYTTDTAAVIDFAAKANASVTMLQISDKKLQLIIESEDHKNTETFTIYLGQSRPLEADDSNNDYNGKITLSCSSEGASNSDVAHVLDGNTDTIWHSTWNSSQWGNNLTTDNHPWISFTFEEAVEVSALRYLPRPSSNSGGSNNGTITKYRIEVQKAMNGEWEKWAEGTWPLNGQNWKIANFTPVSAYALRLVAVESFSDKENEVNKYASAAEIRIASVADTKIYDGKMSGTGSSEGSQWPSGNAVDKNTGTFWQTDWNADAPEGGPYYTLTLEEEVTIDQLRYYPRYGSGDGDQNGFISRYAIYVSTDGENWSENPVASNTEDSDASLVIANKWFHIDFAEPVAAKYVRICAKEVYISGNYTKEVGNNMSIAELQVRQVLTKTLVNNEQILELRSAISDAESHDESLYTQDSWSNLQAILRLAKNLLEESSPYAEDVTAKTAALRCAIGQLVQKSALSLDDEFLMECRQLEEKMYTPDSWNVFAKALAMLDSVGENTSSKSADIIYRALSNARDALVLRADKVALENSIAGTRDLLQSDYTEESWNQLLAVIEEATRIFNDANATESEVSDVLNRLQAAIDGLKAIEVPDNDEKNDSANEPGSNDKNDPTDTKKPAAGTGNAQSSSNRQPSSSSTAAAGTGAKTGDPASLMMWIMVMFSMAMLVFVMRKRSR